ncbi:MAG: hypothetical protein AAFZ52_17050 [Bacteroidota bacterium]
MRCIMLLLVCCLTAGLHAQFGLTAYANFHNVRHDFVAAEIDELVQLETGVELAAHYWFRLPTKRVEFQPTVYYTATDNGEVDHNFDEFGFQFKTNFYLFDFGTDCDCPTFGKQGPNLQKGFFVQLAPGYAFYDYDTAARPDQPQSGFTATAAVGIDFGLNNLLTITPIAGLRYGFAPFNEFELLDLNAQPVGTYQARLTTYQIGLQATFRLDKRRY